MLFEQTMKRLHLYLINWDYTWLNIASIPIKYYSSVLLVASIAMISIPLIWGNIQLCFILEYAFLLSMQDKKPIAM